MSKTNPSIDNDLRAELDDLIDNLWGRALDMTSDDFKDDKDYETAKTNYRNYCLKELNALFTQYKIQAVKEAQLGLVEYFDQVPSNDVMDWKGLFADTRKLIQEEALNSKDTE